MISSYRDLEVWKLAVDFARRAYEVTREFPKEEMYGLTSQIRRATTSVAANIAEGHARYSTKDFMRFLGIANGSLVETETLLEIASRVHLLSAPKRDELLSQTRRIGQMIIALRRSLRNRIQPSTKDL